MTPRVVFRNGHYSVALAVPRHQLAQLVPLYEIAKSDLTFMCGNDKKLGEAIFGNPFDQVDAEMIRLGVENTGGNRIARNLGLPGKGLKNFFEFYITSQEDMAAALIQAYEVVCRSKNLANVTPKQIDQITNQEDLLSSERNTKLLKLVNLDKILTGHNDLLIQLQTRAEEKQTELDKCNSEVKTACERKAELEVKLVELQNTLADQQAILAEIKEEVTSTTETIQKKKRQLEDTDASYQSKKAKMEELQTGDAMAFASIMYWHVLGEDHFDLNRIISALVARGDEEDCSMIEVIKRIQNTPTRSQTRVAKSTHSDTGRADGKPQGQPPDGGASGEAEKSPTESASEELEESTEELENSTNLTGPISALNTKDDDGKLPVSTA